MTTRGKTIESRWMLKTLDESVIKVISESCGISPLQARLIGCRGVITEKSARSYLDPSLDELHDPFEFSEMEQAVAIVREAVAEGETILIHGDFDADGVTGTALLYRFLRELGADVRYFVPRRARDGYGLARRVMEKGIEAGLKLVISVDCGASDSEIVSYLSSRGVKTIITDHHEVEERVGADAVINPKLSSEAYPFKDLAGVGVAFKLLEAVAQRISPEFPVEEYLDLVALGTLGDYMPLREENRILVARGLAKLKEWSRPGIEALRETSRLPRDGFTARQVCFTIVPRLNSPGRIGSAGDVVSLLLEEDRELAVEKALAIEEKNVQRKFLDNSVTEEACYLADIYLKRDDPNALVFSSASWHEGVVGIGAARLAERYGLPAALIAVQENGTGKGSVRSAGNVNIRKALKECSEMLIDHGGHREAGGFRLKEDKIAEFTRIFNMVVGELSEEDGYRGEHEVDAVVEAEECSLELLSFMELMAPFGPGNPEPLFMMKGVVVGEECRIVGKGHLKFSGSQGGAGTFDFIGFSMGKSWKPHQIFGRKLDILVNFRKNFYRGKMEKQFRVRALRIGEDERGASD